MAPELVTQIRDVLGEYETRGGRVQMVTFDGSGHGPPFDAADRWAKLFWEHVASAG
jgi:pimeloyl-ACP methyl ester carboxylesterase